MAKAMTYSRICTRFANLASPAITINDAVEEAIDRIYEMGRYPGTTTEVPLASEDFLFDTDNEYHYLLFPESDYDGAVGFRNNSRGWAIMDQVALFKDGINAGDREFIDLGTVAGNRLLLVSGDADPSIGDELEYAGLSDGGQRGAWSTDGSMPDAPASGNWTIVYWSGDQWAVITYINAIPVASWYGEENVQTPDLVTTWTPGVGASGSPVFSFSEAAENRKYRCPLGWDVNGGPFFALMKLEAPVLEENTIVQIGTGPMKHAILAVIYEYTADDERALLNWAQFDEKMGRAQRQTNGPKRYTLGMDKSLRRRPRQFR